jgi:hypothetical protein
VHYRENERAELWSERRRADKTTVISHGVLLFVVFLLWAVLLKKKSVKNERRR